MSLADADADNRLLQVLRARAGIAPSVDELTLVHRGVSIAVKYERGSSSALHLRTRYPEGLRGEPIAGAYRGGQRALVATRPMSIGLRFEDSHDVASKEQGKAIEVQIGDPAFDGYIFIDSPSSGDVVRSVLGPEARAAVVAIVRGGCTDLTLDDARGDIWVRIAATDHLEQWGPNADVLLDALATLATFSPPVRATGLAHAPDPRRPLIAGIILSLIAALVALISLAPNECAESCDDATCLRFDAPICVLPYPIALVFALAIFIVLAFTVARPPPISSNSHRRTSTRVLALAMSFPAGLALAYIVAWAILR
jgi:hypothetical protein